MRGKEKCKILKEIRQKLADENNIEIITSECEYTGECKGTCPKCEQELMQLENELMKQKRAGKAVLIAGVALGVALRAAGIVAVKEFVESEEFKDIKELYLPGDRGLQGDIAIDPEGVVPLYPDEIEGE